MKFPKAKIILAGQYLPNIGQRLSLQYQCCETIEEAFEDCEFIPYGMMRRVMIKSLRKYDVIALTTDKRLVWYRHRGNGKNPLLKLDYKIPDNARFVYIGYNLDVAGYFFNIDYSKLLFGINQRDKCGQFRVYKLCVDYKYDSKNLFGSLENISSGEYDKELDRICNLPKDDPDELYYQIMTNILAEVYQFRMTFGIVHHMSAWWQFGNDITRSYFGFKDPEKYKNIVKNIQYIFMEDFIP